MTERGQIRRAGLSGLVAVALLLAVAPARAGALDPALEERVKASIDVGLRHLRFQQRDDGSWNGDLRATGLVLRALMESHRRYTAEDGPFVRRALEYMAGEIDPAGATLEEAALATVVLGSSSDPDHRLAAAAARESVIEMLTEQEANAMACPGLLLARESLRVAGGGTAHAGPPAVTARVESCQRELLGFGGDGGLVAVQWPGEDRAPASHRSYFLSRALSEGMPALDAAERQQLRSELAGRLTAGQRFEGSWLPAPGNPYVDDPVVASAFALLALERLYDEGSWP